MQRRELAALSIATLVLAWLLFLPGFIGMANNGDFGKIAGRLCIAGEDNGADNFLYFRSDYIRNPQQCYEANLPSSEHALASIASQIELRVSDPSRFDIRWLAAVHAILWLLAYALLLVSIRPLDGFRWWIAALAALLIFFDVSNVAYLNSFYTDVAALIGAFGMIAILPALQARAKWAPGFAAFALLFITSKPQHAFLFAIPAALLTLVAWRARRFTPVLLACVIAAAALWTIRANPDLLAVTPRFNLIFSKIRPSVQDAAPLGLTPADLGYIGINAFDASSPTRDIPWARDFVRRTSNVALMRYYLRHPGAVLRFFSDDLQHEAPEMRPSNVSNFRREDGHPPGARTGRMALWSDLRARLFALWPAHIVVWYAFALALGAWKRSWLILFALAMGAGEFALASLGDALETHRHLLLFHLFTDATGFGALMIALAAARPVRTQSGKPIPS